MAWQTKRSTGGKATMIFVTMIDVGWRTKGWPEAKPTTLSTKIDVRSRTKECPPGHIDQATKIIPGDSPAADQPVRVSQPG
ncbi:MAG TPA: hypothetical protein VGS19_26150 [Streptosporangiaceae bacterium]|nr:hypothetical protein [Streptosporangiaceae bacterium]